MDNKDCKHIDIVWSNKRCSIVGYLISGYCKCCGKILYKNKEGNLVDFDKGV